MALFGFFGGSGGGDRRRASASSSPKDEIAKSNAAEKAFVAAAVDRFNKNGRTAQAFVSLVHELLRHYDSPALPKDPDTSIFAQTDDLLTVVEMVLALKDHFPGAEAFDDEQMMALSINDLADYFGIKAGLPVAPKPTSPAVQPSNRVVYPIGPRSLQKVDGMLAVIFGTFRTSGATPKAFFVLVQALLRGCSDSPVPTDPRRPIFAQNQDADAIADLLDKLKDEFAGDLNLSDSQIQTVTVVDLIKRCRLSRAP